MSFTPVDNGNLDLAIEILSEAFHDDPVMNWSCNNPESLAPFFEFTLPIFVSQNLTYLDAQNRGVACWQAPGQELKWPKQLSTAFKILQLGGLRGIYRMLLSGRQTEKYHPKKPHYYLFVIGVMPGHKGKGLGTSLISHILKKCDEEGMPAYLENSKEENLGFYQGHGFAVIQEIRFAPDAPPLWLMWREPRPHAAT